MEQLTLRLPGWFFRRRTGFGVAAATLLVATRALTATVGPGQIVDTALLYLLVTLVAAAVWGFAVGLTTAVVADLTVNFFFVPPLHTLSVRDPAHVVTLVLFLAVAATGASMLALLRTQASAAEVRRAEADLLLRLVRDMEEAPAAEDALDRLCGHLQRVLGGARVDVLEDDGTWQILRDHTEGSQPVSRDEALLASVAVRDGRTARIGPTSDRHLLIRSARGVQAPRRVLLVPLAVPRPPAALRIAGKIAPPVNLDVERVLAGFAAEASTALARMRLAGAAREAEALRRADRFKSLLLSAVSHDLRSPLTAIRTAVDNLRDPAVEWEPADTTKFLEIIDSQTALLTETVANLLEMSRIESGAVRTRVETVNVRSLVEDAASARQPALAGRPVDISVVDTLSATGDHDLLVRALSNLVENAARYSRPGGRIRIAAAARPDGVAIDVIDEGPRIPREELDRVFNKFYRGAQAGKTLGSGLGLSIAKGIVELCGGSLQVEASPSGNRFTMLLSPRATLS